MRESIGGTWLFMIVIFFIVLFTGYLCMSINQSKAFAVKNSIIRIIERHGINNMTVADLANDGAGNENSFKNEISRELATVGYRSTISCDETDDWVGFNVEAEPGVRPFVFCVKVAVKNPTPTGHEKTPSDNLHYFMVKTSYQFDIPVFNSLFKWEIDGITKPMM